MSEASLSADQVEALCQDIGQAATEITLLRRVTAAGKTPGGPRCNAEMLRIACGQFLSGSVQRIQIRYRWQDAQWIDTLDRKGTIIRLVRIRHPAPA